MMIFTKAISHFGQAVEELADDVVGAAHQIGGKAEQDGEDDQRQHGAAAQQAHKVVGGEEVHDHVGEGGVLADGSVAMSVQAPAPGEPAS